MFRQMRVAVVAAGALLVFGAGTVNADSGPSCTFQTEASADGWRVTMTYQDTAEDFVIGVVMLDGRTVTDFVVPHLSGDGAVELATGPETDAEISVYALMDPYPWEPSFDAVPPFYFPTGEPVTNLTRARAAATLPPTNAEDQRPVSSDSPWPLALCLLAAFAGVAVVRSRALRPNHAPRATRPDA